MDFADKVAIRVNGKIQKQGNAEDFVISGATITWDEKEGKAKPPSTIWNLHKRLTEDLHNE